MVDTRSREDTLLERFEDLEAIWPAHAANHRVATTSLHSDDVLALDGSRWGSFAQRHKWGLTIAATITALIAWLVFIAAPAYDERLATDTLASYDAALATIDGAVPNARTALAALTAPTADGAELSGSLETLTPFIASANSAREIVAEPLPGTPPLVPRTHIEGIADARLELATVTDQAEALATRLSSLLSYRLLTDGLFALPELPDAAGPDETDTISVELAASLAASVESAVSLPVDPLLDGHRTAAADTLDLLDLLRADYLTALRAEDVATAGALASDMNAAVAELDATLAAALAEVEAWGLRELDLLRVATLEAQAGMEQLAP